MSVDPYRTPARSKAESSASGRPSPPEVAIVTAFVWTLGVLRVAFALARAEAPNRETDLAWLLVILAPFVVWKEIASLRAR